MNKIEKLNSLASLHNQYTSTELRSSMAVTLGWTEEYSKAMLESHCNALSLWLILSASDLITLTYPEFFKFGLETDIYDETAQYTAKGFKPNGYMQVRPQYLCKALGVPVNPEYFYEFDLIANTGTLDSNMLYITVIRGHFMASYISNNKIYLSDTSYRGCGVPADQFIPQDKFKYISKIV